jgi:AcrR family transcriptional regulator
MEAITLPTRKHLLATARKLLDSEGFETLTLREIARRGGLSHGAPLRHFPSLAALLAAVAAQGFRELMASVGAAAAEAGPDATAVERLAAAGHGYVRFALGSPGVFALMFHPDRLDTSDADYRGAGQAAFGQLLELVGAAQAAGFRPDVLTIDLASVVWATVHGLAQLRIQGAMQDAGGAKLEPALDVISDLLFGVRPRHAVTNPRRRTPR